MPGAPHIVSVTVRDFRGWVVSSVVVSLVHSVGTLTATSGSDGLAVFNLSDLSSWTLGDALTITGSADYLGVGSSSSTISSGGGQSETLTLVQGGVYQSEGSIVIPRYRVLLVGPNDDEFTHSNALPVEVVREEQFTQALAYTAGGLTEYVGEAFPGTAASSAGWRIKKLTYSGTNVTDVKWASGTSKFDKVWDDRASYVYS